MYRPRAIAPYLWNPSSWKLSLGNLLAHVARNELAPTEPIVRQHRPCGFWGGLLSFPVVFMQLWRLSVSSNGLDFHFGRWSFSRGLIFQRPVPVSQSLSGQLAKGCSIRGVHDWFSRTGTASESAERLLSHDFK